MKPSQSALLAALGALAAVTVAGGPVFAQTPPGDGGASMVKPPEASGTTNPANPDHMPVKRPPKPTHDKMTHSPPASAADAK
ncbi:hypothetical protein [Paraburkholderia sp. BCC1885]|uniref:hypothetical protein n=1 Tax=Paraburkholderia sp. BCC1885 TaxID=2562669 RepID=UPI001182339C|nr:hypothetical protein [Paraburkholderia sp. BCC1885]